MTVDWKLLPCYDLVLEGMDGERESERGLDSETEIEMENSRINTEENV